MREREQRKSPALVATGRLVNASRMLPLVDSAMSRMCWFSSATVPDAGTLVTHGWNTFKNTICFCMPGSEVRLSKLQTGSPCIPTNDQVDSWADRLTATVVLRRLLPCCHTHAFVCGACGHGSHLHCYILFLWSAVVGHTSVSPRCFGIMLALMRLMSSLKPSANRDI